uniref:Expansin-like CBD domain-containing protein n=1 Tax=Kalanchoe fedtschenkoi TaxID=63787 RepID=A0A7N0ZWD7_KALFE
MGGEYVGLVLVNMMNHMELEAAGSITLMPSSKFCILVDSKPRSSVLVIAACISPRLPSSPALSCAQFWGMWIRLIGHWLQRWAPGGCRSFNFQGRRVPCDYKQNLAVLVEESSQKPHYLAVKILYQGGQTENVGVDVAKVGSANWGFMSRSFGAVWDTSRVPEGPLQFRFIVTAGYDGKYVWAKSVLPQDWKAGQVYDSGIQIDDIAQDGCHPCDGSQWN